MTNTMNGHTDAAPGGDATARRTHELLESRAAKLSAVAWVLAVTLLQWIIYGPHGPLTRWPAAYELLLGLRESLLQFLTARYVF
jgi:hypothetical protein